MQTAPDPTGLVKDDPTDALSIAQMKEECKDYMTPIEYDYFDSFRLVDQRRILSTAKENLQIRNVEKIKAKTFGMEFLGGISHVRELELLFLASHY